ncbi:endonuclease/exonuclease/phosphatase family protein [Lysobacter niastensis]|uniref:Endonuclease/exonuclease/phosphatase family protein n=1 Tax=Lysobacter niastensis TaxID=380629 RepID=A0ABS0B4V4_9GAMM|nr:endonuclease/exonuclease/phosphatase family protein [Lysobacter niastensis]MBF6023743.1 endonuclease/exonuclease/phosphatase family protein [Lysobacter niastensis]
MNEGGHAQRKGAAAAAWRWLRMSNALLVLCLVACRSMAPGDAESPSRDADALDIVTLNLWHDQGDWPRRQPLIVDTLRRLQPDVIVLQEVLQDTGLPNQAGELARQLGYQWHFVSVDPPGRTRRYGNAILARKLLAHGEQPLRPADDYRIAGWVRAEIHGRPLNVYAVHLNFSDATGATRAQQISDLLAFVDATRGDAPAVIAGDFNTTADRPELAPLRTGYFDAYEARHPAAKTNAAEYVTLNPHYHAAPQRIDLVFAQRDTFTPLQSQRILDRPGEDGLWASDHFGVQARLRWNGPGKRP